MGAQAQGAGVQVLVEWGQLVFEMPWRIPWSGAFTSSAGLSHQVKFPCPESGHCTAGIWSANCFMHVWSEFWKCDSHNLWTTAVSSSSMRQLYGHCSHSSLRSEGTFRRYTSRLRIFGPGATKRRFLRPSESTSKRRRQQRSSKSVKVHPVQTPRLHRAEATAAPPAKHKVLK